MIPKTEHPASGIDYFTRAASLIVAPQLRWFVLVPIFINLVLFVVLTSILVQQFNIAMEWLLGSLPEWLEFLAWILWTLFAVLVLLVYGYCFSMITTLLAAPFYGILAEKTEILVSGQGPPPETLAKMIPRVLGRELVKLWYFISRGLLVTLLMLVLSLLPLVNVVVPAIAFLWGAWSMVIQYSDYAADNNQLPFRETRRRLGINKYSSYGLGSLIMVGAMIPLANIFVIPISVVAGTIYWSEELKHYPCR